MCPIKYALRAERELREHIEDLIQEDLALSALDKLVLHRDRVRHTIALLELLTEPKIKCLDLQMLYQAPLYFWTLQPGVSTL